MMNTDQNVVEFEKIHDGYDNKEAEVNEESVQLDREEEKTEREGKRERREKGRGRVREERVRDTIRLVHYLRSGFTLPQA